MQMDLRQYEFKIFTLVRILGVGVRPLILYLCIVLPNPELGLQFGLLVSAVASSFLVLANQNFRKIYDYVAGDAPKRRGLGGRGLFFIYLEGAAIHVVAFLPLAAALCWVWTTSLELTLICVVFILLEKYFDDDQRIAIYQRRYFDWSINFAFRVIIPSLVLLASMLLWTQHLLWIYTGAAVISLVVYLTLKRRIFVRLVWAWMRRLGQPPSWGTRLARYWRDYRQEFAFAQAWVFLSGSFLLIDRFIVVRLNETVFAEYVFYSNLANVIPLIHGLLYFTKVRPKLIDRTGPILRHILAPQNLGLPLALGLMMPVGVWAALALGILKMQIGYGTITGLGGLYALSAMSLVVSELAFWRLKRIWMALLEILAMALVGLAAFGLGLPVNAVPWLVAGVLGLKLSASIGLMYLARNTPALRVEEA